MCKGMSGKGRGNYTVDMDGMKCQINGYAFIKHIHMIYIYVLGR